jgi:hypothetical protein
VLGVVIRFEVLGFGIGEGEGAFIGKFGSYCLKQCDWNDYW